MSKIKDFFIRFDEKCIRMSDLKFTFCIFGLKMALFLITIPLELMLIGTEGIENYPVEPTLGIDFLDFILILMPRTLVTSVVS